MSPFLTTSGGSSSLSSLMMVPETGDDFSSSKLILRMILCLRGVVDFFKLDGVLGAATSSFFCVVALGDDGEGVAGGVIGTEGLKLKSKGGGVVGL